MSVFIDRVANIGHKIIDILIVLVFLEAVLTTYPWFEEQFESYIQLFDYWTMVIFCIEIILRIVYGGKNFWIGRNWAWNWFDLVVTVITAITSGGVFASLRSLRLLRLLRLLRVFTIFNGLRVLVSSLLHSIPKIGWLVALWGAVMIIYSVIGCHLFGKSFPMWFGSLGETCYTMFQVMTLESWSMGIARPVIAEFPLASFYFVSYICITAFIMLNALTGVLVSSMTEESMNKEETEDTKDAKMDQLIKEIQQLRKEISDMKK